METYCLGLKVFLVIGDNEFVSGGLSQIGPKSLVAFHKEVY